MFTPIVADNAAAQVQDVRDRVVANHLAFVPPGDGPFPTLIAIPGCSGIAFQDPTTEAMHPDLNAGDRLFRSHYLRQADNLRAEGFAVLLIHVQAAEELLTACGGEIGGERLAGYIDEAVSWARGLDFVDATQIHLIGWSMGGRGVLVWLHGPRTEARSVRSAVAVYPACSGEEPPTSHVPLLMLLGDADDIADPSECEALATSSPAARTITIRRYPGARHGFDISGAPAVVDAGVGRTIGYQRAAAEAAREEILAFLSQRR